ncbi:MAG: hypothetical protein ABI199_06350 [Bacteroidia bacterium]
MKKYFFAICFVSLFCFNSEAQNAVSKNNFSDSLKIKTAVVHSVNLDLSDILYSVPGTLDFFENPDETIIDADDYKHLPK